MKRITCILIIVEVVMTMSVTVFHEAEANITTIEQLIRQVTDPSVSLQRKTIEEIALVTYEVLMNVPFVGIKESQAEIEGLIVLRKTLETHTGVLERLLALSMQDGIDRTLMFETARRLEHLLGGTVTPPYQVDTLQPETVSALLQANTIAEREAIQYIRTLNGKFAAFCRSKNFSIEDFLTGKALGALTDDLGSLMWDIQFAALSTAKKNLEDIQFMYTLVKIDQSKDVRILCDIYLTESPASWKELRAQIEQQLGSPRPIRVSDGSLTTPDAVYDTLEKHTGKSQKDYPRLLTGLFLPYFSDTEAISDKIQEVFTKYTGKMPENILLPPPGVWLELAE